MFLGLLPQIANGPFQRWRSPRISSWGIFSRPYGTGSFFELYPGLTSWATLSRPYGTKFGEDNSHTRSKALIAVAFAARLKPCPSFKEFRQAEHSRGFENAAPTYHLPGVPLEQGKQTAVIVR